MEKQEKFVLAEAAKWTSIASIIGVLLNLSFNSLLTHIAAPSVVGITLAFIALGTLISQFLQFGFQTSVVAIISSALARDEHFDGASVAKKIFVLIALNALVAGLLLVLISHVYTPDIFSFFADHGQTIIPLLLTIFAFALALRSVAASIDRSFERNAQATLSGALLPSLLQLLFLGGLAVIAESPTASKIICIFVFAHLLCTAIYIKYTLSALPNGQSSTSYSVFTLYRTGSLFFVNGFIFALFSQLGVLYLQYLGAFQELAIYGVPSRLMITVSVPVMMLMQYLTPHISKSLVAGKFNSLNRITKAATTICFLYYFSLLIFFYLFGETTFTVLFGEFYSQANDIMLILLLGSMISVIFGFVIKIIEMSKYKNFSFFPGVISIFVTMATMPLAYERYSTIGVAFSIAAGVIISRALGCLIIYKYLGILTFGFFNFFKLLKIKEKNE